MTNKLTFFWLAIVTANELGLAFQEPSPKNSSRSVHVLFSYRGNRQTNRQTYAGDSIIPRGSFCGDNKLTDTLHVIFFNCRLKYCVQLYRR